jgi:hypothetical protein
MRYRTRNTDRTVIGRYAGKRIAGTSNDVWDVLLTTQYDFADFTITVTNIPAHWDREQDRIFLTSEVGKRLNSRVLDMAERIVRTRQEDDDKTPIHVLRNLLRAAPTNYVLDGAEFIRDAA